MTASTLPCEIRTESTDTVWQNEVTIKCIEITGKILSDQTGIFPKTSSKGSKYNMVAYMHNYNTMIVEPFKSIS